MSIQELQEKLILKIRNTKEDYILEEIGRLLEFEENSSDIYQLNEEQEQLIIKSLSEIDRGESFTDEQVQKEADQWLEK